jgi:glycosyltransferase involved in cell wall biosynthesis
MKISVITVCRNSAATIGGTLDSFFAQSHADKELIVVDGGSTDATLDIVRAWSGDDVTVISEPDRGIYDAMNKGLRAFGGDAVGFLNSDDRYANPDALTAIAEGLDEADIVFGDLDFVASHTPRTVVRRWRPGPYKERAFTRGWMPPHPTFYCRRQVVDAVGAFDLRYTIAADYDYMLRSLELAAFRAKVVSRVLIDMLHGGASSAGVAVSLHHNFEALDSRRRRLGAGLVDYALFAKPLRKITQFVGIA